MTRLAILSVMLLAGCTTASKKIASAPACPASGVPAVAFYLARISPTPDEAARLPKAYTAYRVSAEEWKAFAAKVKERGADEHTGLALPMPDGCSAFSMTVSNAMTPELAAKYPDMAPMQGEAADGSKLRLEWDGARARAQVLRGSEAIFLEPFNIAGDVFYLLYNKADAAGGKAPFEKDLQRPAPEGSRGSLQHHTLPANVR